MKTYIINLEKRKDRLEYINNNYKNELYELEIFKAYDGKYTENNSKEYINFKNIFINSINKNKNNKSLYNYNQFNELADGELGCFISHLMIWKKIIDKNIDKAIIFEDDCIFNSDFNNKVNKIISDEIPNNFNILYFGGRCGPNNYHNNNIKISENIAIKKYKEPYGTFAYMISRNGAELLYNYALNEFRGKLGVDYFMEEFLSLNNHIIHIVSPNICYSIIDRENNTIWKSSIQ